MLAQMQMPQQQKIIATNAVGLGVLAALNPLLRYTSNPVGEWLLSLITALIFAVVVNWLYSKLARKPGGGGVKGIAMIAWFFVASTVLVPYIDKAQMQSAPVGAPVVTNVGGQVSKPAKPLSEIDEIMKDAPAYQPPR